MREVWVVPDFFTVFEEDLTEIDVSGVSSKVFQVLPRGSESQTFYSEGILTIH